jgi:ubiquinone/menaquinone biosynthesis C-methylase UbiE
VNTTHSIQKHYGIPEISTRIEDALQQAGYGDGPIAWADLAPLDQFHTRGLIATRELAERLDLTEGSAVLDVGSGLGGPARFLAAAYGCQVTGIELTPLYVEVAQMLSQRTGLADRTRFVQGDALELPFEAESFAFAWTQHVAMNIPDKAKLYGEIARVLKKGGRLAIYDVLKGENEPVIYPTPWAFEPGISFLVSPSEMKEALEAAGFQLVSGTDTTEAALAWFSELQKTPQTNPLSLGAILGPQVQQAVGNLGRNLKEGRVSVMQVIVQKS